MAEMADTPRYFRPADLVEALRLLANLRPGLVAGGTDFYPALGERKVQGPLLDLSAITALRQVSRVQRHGGEALRLGALVTWSDFLGLPEASMPALMALQQCAREVGGRQIQNRGTLIGNVCNASPAADGIPALMACGASLEIRSARGQRWLSLEEFVLGPRKTALGADELVTAVEIPLQDGRVNSLFLKMGTRRFLVISIAMLAAQWRQEANGFCRIAVGACSPVARRLTPLEQWFERGMPAPGRDSAIRESLDCLDPIDDVRADRAYRLQLVSSLCHRLVLESSVERNHG